MRLLVTRPEPQASAWVRLFEARGQRALALPLMAILPAEDQSSVVQAWQHMAVFNGLMFVSPSAVQSFVDARPPPCVWPSRVWAAAPGPGTARLLGALGAAEILAPGAEAEQFDTEALWAQIGMRDWQGQRILIVHGGAGRDELARRWAAAGAVVDKLQAYRRGVPTWNEAQSQALAEARQSPADHAWLFSSGESITRLLEREPSGWAAHRALCTHPAIADRANAAGFGLVQTCKPDIDAIMARLEQGSAGA